MIGIESVVPKHSVSENIENSVSSQAFPGQDGIISDPVQSQEIVIFPAGELADSKSHRIRWTPKRIEDLVTSYNAGQPVGQIAENLGGSKAAIYTRVSILRKQGFEIPFRNKGRAVKFWTQEKIDDLVARCHDKQPYDQIAGEMGRSLRSVTAHVYELRKKGIQIPYRRISKWQENTVVQNLIELIESGHRNTQIAQIYETTEGAIKSALHRIQESGTSLPSRRVDSEKLLLMFENGESLDAISEYFQITVKTLYKYRKSFQQEGKLPILDMEKRNGMITYWSEQGLPVKEIAEKINQQFSPFKITPKAVEGVRAALIKEGRIRRHKKGGRGFVEN